MALVTIASDFSIDANTAKHASQVPDLVAGEAILAGAACYVKSDGKIWMSNGTAANAASSFVGFAARAAAAGQPITVYGPGTRMRYAASGLTPGTKLFLGTTAGRLDTAATTGDAVGVAWAVSATDIIALAQKIYAA